MEVRSSVASVAAASDSLFALRSYANFAFDSPSVSSVTSVVASLRYRIEKPVRSCSAALHVTSTSATSAPSGPRRSAPR